MVEQADFHQVEGFLQSDGQGGVGLVEVRLLDPQRRRLLEILQTQGAKFFDELLDCGGWLKVELEDALSQLAAQGLVSSDSFAGFRALALRTGPKPVYRSRASRGYGGGGHGALDNAGRWSLVRDGAPLEDPWEAVQYIAQVLLKRYGVVFRQLLDVESNVPSWRELHYIYRRMEARGEVRGGRFVKGFFGEQLALPEAVGALRRIENKHDGTLLSINAADPLNLSGVICTQRAPALSKNRILFRGGKPIATLTAGNISWLEPVGEQEQWAAQQKLISVPTSKAKKYRHPKKLVAS